MSDGTAVPNPEGPVAAAVLNAGADYLASNKSAYLPLLENFAEHTVTSVADTIKGALPTHGLIGFVGVAIEHAIDSEEATFLSDVQKDGSTAYDNLVQSIRNAATKAAGG